MGRGTVLASSIGFQDFQDIMEFWSLLDPHSLVIQITDY
jgi:hypothetical protein